MLGIAIRHIVDDQFVCVIVAVEFSQRCRVGIDDRAVSNPLDSIALI